MDGFPKVEIDWFGEATAAAAGVAARPLPLRLEDAVALITEGLAILEP